MLHLLYRYVESAPGRAGVFSLITDIDFLSSTQLICVDSGNHCLRQADLRFSPPLTSTLAGNCTASGNADGHRVNSALFQSPQYSEVNSKKLSLFVLDDHGINLRKVDLSSDKVTTLATFKPKRDLKFIGDDSLLYLAEYAQVTVYHLDKLEQTVLAGFHRPEKDIGSFKQTRFTCVKGLLPWGYETETHLIVADHDNNRFAIFLNDLIVINKIILLFTFSRFLLKTKTSCSIYSGVLMITQLFFDFSFFDYLTQITNNII